MGGCGCRFRRREETSITWGHLVLFPSVSTEGKSDWEGANVRAFQEERRDMNKNKLLTYFSLCLTHLLPSTAPTPSPISSLTLSNLFSNIFSLTKRFLASSPPQPLHPPSSPQPPASFSLVPTISPPLLRASPRPPPLCATHRLRVGSCGRVRIRCLRDVMLGRVQRSGKGKSVQILRASVLTSLNAQVK